MNKFFAGRYVPSALVSCLRIFTFGHVRQLQSATRAFLRNLGA